MSSRPDSIFCLAPSSALRLAAPARFITPHGKHGENWIDYENQPACHMAHLFSHAGAPWLTQQ